MMSPEPEPEEIREEDKSFANVGIFIWVVLILATINLFFVVPYTPAQNLALWERLLASLLIVVGEFFAFFIAGLLLALLISPFVVYWEEIYTAIKKFITSGAFIVILLPVIFWIIIFFCPKDDASPLFSFQIGEKVLNKTVDSQEEGIIVKRFISKDSEEKNSFYYEVEFSANSEKTIKKILPESDLEKCSSDFIDYKNSENTGDINGRDK